MTTGSLQTLSFRLLSLVWGPGKKPVDLSSKEGKWRPHTQTFMSQALTGSVQQTQEISISLKFLIQEPLVSGLISS